MTELEKTLRKLDQEKAMLEENVAAATVRLAQIEKEAAALKSKETKPLAQ